MPAQLKQSLDEIKAMYSLEPSLRDIYVEGKNELHIIKWFLKMKGKTNVEVYTIDVVELEDDLFERFNLSKNSNRNKVIITSEVLSEYFDKNRLKVKCIADADFDRHLGKIRQNYILQFTDYTSTEMYFFNESFLTKFFDLVLHGFAIPPREMILRLKNVLERIFLIRLTNESLGWGMSCIDFKDYLSWNNNDFTFEEDRYIINCLRSNGKGREIETFINVMSDYEQRLDNDPRQNIRGHDFTKLFRIVVRRLKGHRARYNDLSTFEGTLCGCLELSFLENETLFVKLGA